MSQQMDLQFIADKKRREELLRKLKLRGHKNRTLLAGILNNIDSFNNKGKACYQSHDTFAEIHKVSRKTIVRAFATLATLNLVATIKRANNSGKVLNHYSIIWPELEALVASEQGDIAQSVGTVGESVGTVGESVGTVEASAGTVQCPTTNKELTKELTNEREELVELVFSLGMRKAKAAIDGAERLGLSGDEIRERVEEWRRLRLDDAKLVPGVLFYWLGMPGSWEKRNAAPVSAIVYAPKSGRGDALSREEIEAHGLRVRIKREGLAAGVGLDEIERRWQVAGV